MWVVYNYVIGLGVLLCTLEVVLILGVGGCVALMMCLFGFGFGVV